MERLSIPGMARGSEVRGRLDSGRSSTRNLSTNDAINGEIPQTSWYAPVCSPIPQADLPSGWLSGATYLKQRTIEMGSGERYSSLMKLSDKPRVMEIISERAVPILTICSIYASIVGRIAGTLSSGNWFLPCCNTVKRKGTIEWPRRTDQRKSCVRMVIRMLRSEVDAFLVVHMTMSGLASPWHISPPSYTTVFDMQFQLLL